MKTVEFWRWQIVDCKTGCRRATRWRMTVEDALALDPHAQRVENSLELRRCPETAEERRSQVTGAFLHPKEGSEQAGAGP
jgi:hypothetical protein